MTDLRDSEIPTSRQTVIPVPPSLTEVLMALHECNANLAMTNGQIKGTLERLGTLERHFSTLIDLSNRVSRLEQFTGVLKAEAHCDGQ